jgi:DNA invertase Pin-like site-specific DNA recombinase
MDTENNNTAVIYARVSSTVDRQNTEHQVSDLSTLAIQKGLSIEKVYEEHVSGSKKNIDRPILTD